MNGQEAALEELEQLRQDPLLAGHHLLHAAIADALDRLDRRDEAIREWHSAVGATQDRAEAEHLQRRLDSHAVS